MMIMTKMLGCFLLYYGTSVHKFIFARGANGCLLSADSFEQEAKSKQKMNVEIKKLTAEIMMIKWYPPL